MESQKKIKYNRDDEIFIDQWIKGCISAGLSRRQIQKLHKQRYPNHLGLGNSRIQRIKQNSSIKDREINSGNFCKKTTLEEDKVIIQQLEDPHSRFMSWKEHTQIINNKINNKISEKTVIRRAHEVGIYGRPAKKKPALQCEQLIT